MGDKLRLMKKIEKIYPGLILVLFILLVTALGFSYDQYFKSSDLKNVDHSSMSSMDKMPDYMMNMPGMMGDKTRRYTVDWEYPDQIIPGQVANMKFRVFNAASGEPVDVFTKNYTKLMHLIITDSSLTSYQHLHPEYRDGWFEIPVTFPQDGRYNLYLDFVPLGAVEQQIGVSLTTSGYTEAEEAIKTLDLTAKDDNGYTVNIDYAEPLEASELSVGEKKLVFEISRNGELVNTLKPYLGAFGHMVMINADTYEYYHVHPVQSGELADDANGGPKIEFAPMAMFQAIKPGTYRLFAQFNPDGNLIMVPFTIKVE